MDLNLSQDQKSIQQLAGLFATEHLAPFAKEWDEGEIFPLETFKRAASLGFAGLFVKEAYSGVNLTRFDGVLIFEQLSSGLYIVALNVIFLSPNRSSAPHAAFRGKIHFRAPSL